MDYDICMSAKTIAAFNARLAARGVSLVAPRVDVTGCAPKRAAKTNPPPAPSSLADDMERQAAEKERMSHQLAAEAEELRAAARGLRRAARIA